MGNVSSQARERLLTCLIRTPSVQMGIRLVCCGCVGAASDTGGKTVHGGVRLETGKDS